MADLPGLSCNVVGNIPSLTHSIKRDTIANTELNTILYEYTYINGLLRNKDRINKIYYETVV
jgi:hypothetical protein